MLALPLLWSCASDPEVRVVTKTETVEVAVEVYRELPDILVEAIPYPPALPERFEQRDLLDLVFTLYDRLDLANMDRARAGRIVKGQEQ